MLDNDPAQPEVLLELLSDLGRAASIDGTRTRVAPFVHRGSFDGALSGLAAFLIRRSLLLPPPPKASLSGVLWDEIGKYAESWSFLMRRDGRFIVF